MRTTLVTGATGFIGGHIVDAALKKGPAVRALVLSGDPGAGELQAKGVEVFTGDIRDDAVVEKACAGREVVFHCAAVATDWAPREMFTDVTIGGMENICRAALKAGVRRFVDISTSDVFGTDEDRIMDETGPLTLWNEPYPDAKIAAERIAWRYHREHGLPVSMVYPLWVYGPRDRTFVPLLADAIIKRDLVFWQKGAIVWPTYIDNLMDLLMLIAEDDCAVGNGYLVHDGESTTLEEFCAGIARALGVPEIRTYIPYLAAYAAAAVMESAWRLFRIQTRPLLTTYTVKNLGSHLRFSIAKAERELGWKPRISYREGFATTMAWLKTLNRSALKQK